MKFYSFHLMPYVHLDMDYDKEFDSAWCTLPNSMYDPEKGHLLYNRFLDELEFSDKLGFDGICVNEHHQTAYGMMSIPVILAGALSRRTSRAKIAVLGRALPLINTPQIVAEEYAILDNITGGRFVAGFVRGIGAEYHVMGVNPAESLARFNEAHDLIIRAWTEPGPFAFEGKYYHFDYVNTWPRPYQKPHPPVWIPSQGSSDTIRFASHPDRKYTYLQTFAPQEIVAGVMDLYRAQANEYGYESQPSQLGLALPVYVAETDELAVKQARVHIEALFNKFLRMPMDMLLPAGYTSLDSMVRMIKRTESRTDQVQTIEGLMKTRMFLCGSPATVRELVEETREKVGIGTLCTMLQFGTLPHDLTLKSQEMFAKEVIPHFRVGNSTTTEYEAELEARPA